MLALQILHVSEVGFGQNKPVELTCEPNILNGDDLVILQDKLAHARQPSTNSNMKLKTLTS